MSQSDSQSIQSVLKETRTFAPPATFSANAHISSEQQYEAMWNRAKDDPAGFWGEMAANLHWFRKWDHVIQGHMPETKWFVGGKTNACYNCVDRHVYGASKNKAAIIWEGEPGDTRVLRYQDLHREVCKFANVLKKTRRADRRPSHVVHADDSGTRDRDAGLLCANRCGPFDHLRWLQF